jgi:hypothetical protein
MGDVAQMFEDIAAHPQFEVLQYRITDFLDVTAHSATKEEVEDIVGLDFAHSLRNKQMLKASVATDPKLLALLHHWYRTNANPERLGVFTSVDDARGWVTEQLKGQDIPQ